MKPAPGGSIAAFARLWAAMLFTYSTVKFVFNLVVLGYLDLTHAAALELVIVPLGQAVLFWLITRRTRRSSDEAIAATTP
jgi:hypothetical protein